MFDPTLIAVPIILGVVGIVVLGLVVSHKMEKKRVEQLAGIAQELGFSFEPEAKWLLATGAGGLPIFNRGHSKKTRNALQKTVRGTEIILLDHQYTIGSGKNSHTHRHTVAIFHPAAGTEFPDFEMKPETLFHKIGAMFGYQDIDFDSHPRFSKQYLVRGTDEAGIRATFSRNVLDFLEASGTRWSVESRANWMAVYQNSRVKVDAVPQFVTDTTRIFLLFVPRSSVGQEE